MKVCLGCDHFRGNPISEKGYCWHNLEWVKTIQEACGDFKDRQYSSSALKNHQETEPKISPQDPKTINPLAKEFKHSITVGNEKGVDNS